MDWNVWGDFSDEPPHAHAHLGTIPAGWTRHRIAMNQGVTMTIEQVDEAGEKVADLSPEPKKRKGRPQPEDKVPTDPNLPAVGSDVWLCEGGVWAEMPRKVDTHGVTSNGDAFQVKGFSTWFLMRHLGKYWSDFDPKGSFGCGERLSTNVLSPPEADKIVASCPTEPFVQQASPTDEISRNPEERTLPIPGTEEPVEPSKKLECAISRHKHLTPDIERFCTRIFAWDVVDAVGDITGAAEVAMDAWAALGRLLDFARISHAKIKVTARSRLRSWLRPGASVALRDDVAGIYSQMYSQEELASLEVMAVLETKVALRARGGRELGLVELAHVKKP